jgi:predicted ArsR family transcriptional regulator
MTHATPEQGRHAPGRRDQVLRLLREATGPMAVAEIAERLDIHVNTARFHLESLAGNGQVERTTAGPRTPGRPPQLFRAVRRMDPAGARHFRVLAEVFADAIGTDPDPGDRVLQAGRSWGRRQASTLTGTEPAETGPAETGPAETEPADSVERLMRLLDELSFAPERAGGGEQPRIGLRHCPFLELAVDRSDLVCRIHLGVMQGAMQSWGSPITVERLDPFVQPDLCMAHLALVGAA